MENTQIDVTAHQLSVQYFNKHSQIVDGRLTLHLYDVFKLEARKDEIATVTKVRAPELMRAMEKGYSLVSQEHLPKVTLVLGATEQALEERKSVVMLDEAPRILKEKGLLSPRSPSGSADQREAILALDKEYQVLQDTVRMLQAVQQLLKDKMRGFEMSFQSVKKVYDSLSNYSSNNSISVGIEEGVEIGQTQVGNPRY